jgi:hypothetical protein
MSLAEFKSTFQGGARPTLYKVTCAFPAGVADAAASTKLQFTCKAFEIPGVSTGLIEVPHMGRMLKLAGDRVFNPVQMTIINDVDWSVRTAFERWSNLINGARENVGATRLGDYAVDMLVEQLNRQGEVITGYTFIGVFPEDVSPIQLGFDMIDTVEEFTVSLQYQWWERGSVGIV